MPMTLSRVTDDGRREMSRGWLSILLVAASLELCASSASQAAATTPTVAEPACPSVVPHVAISKGASSPIPSWGVIEEEAHPGTVARRLLLLKPTVDHPCPGLLELQGTADGRSVVRPAHCRLLSGTSGDTSLCQILDPTKAPKFQEGDRFVCSSALPPRTDRPSHKQRSEP